MELTEVSILGLGAEGSIAFRALAGKPCRVRILAKGERAQRLRAEGITIVHYDRHVAEPGAEPPPRLLIVAVKGYQLEDALDDAATETGPDTVVMSLMNGLTSEEVLARRIGADHLIYCMSRLNARKCGSHVEFQPVGDICIGERDGSVTDRIQEIHDLLDGVVSCRISREILLDIWRKYMFNAAFNTEESILRCRHRWFQQLPETGAADRALMRRILAKCEAVGALLAVDECFLDFSDGGISMKPFLTEQPRLFLLKAFTKSYGMAGIRLGYCLCVDAELLREMSKGEQPWNVSSLAQAAGVAALQAQTFLEKTRALVKRERVWLTEALTDLGFRVIPSNVNYLLFRGPLGLTEALKEKGILIRNCENYPGLCPGWYRIAVRRHEENETLMQAVREVCSWQKT